MSEKECTHKWKDEVLSDEWLEIQRKHIDEQCELFEKVSYSELEAENKELKLGIASRNKVINYCIGKIYDASQLKYIIKLTKQYEKRESKK